MSKFGKRLIKAAKEARAIARGDLDANAYRVHVVAEVNAKKTRPKPN